MAYKSIERCTSDGISVARSTSQRARGAHSSDLTVAHRLVDAVPFALINQPQVGD